MSGSERTERFRPNMWSLMTLSLIALIVGGNAVWTFARHTLTSSSINSAGAAGGVAGSLIGGILCIGLMAYGAGLVGFYIFRRSNRAGNGVFIGFLALYFIGVVIPNFLGAVERADQRKREAAALQDIKREGEKAKDELRDNLADPDAPILGGEHMEGTLQALERQIQTLDGVAKIEMEELLVVMRELQRLRTEYAAKINPVHEGELWWPAFHTSLEELIAAKGRVREAREASARLIKAVESLPTVLEKRLRARQLPSKEVSDFIKGFKGPFEAQSRLGLQSQAFDVVALDSSLALYELLEQHWGKWSVQDDGFVLFEESVPDNVIDAYNQHESAILTAGEEQTAINEQIFGPAGTQ